MNTLPQNSHDVHSNPDFDLDFATLDGDDMAWWAEACDSYDAGLPAPDCSDRAWVRDEADYWLARMGEGQDLAGLVAHELRNLSGSMAFHKADDAPSYARAKSIDLARVWAPAGGARRSALAAALDVEASWYLHLDTAAGRLVAYHLEYLADQCEDYDAATVEDYLIGEAAERAAMLDAVCGV